MNDKSIGYLIIDELLKADITNRRSSMSWWSRWRLRWKRFWCEQRMCMGNHYYGCNETSRHGKDRCIGCGLTKEEIDYGHRQDRQDSGSTAGAVRAASDSTTRTKPAAAASAGGGAYGAGIMESLRQFEDLLRQDAVVIPTTPQPVPQEIIAWRAWILTFVDGEPRLMSTTLPVIWDGPTLVADKVPALDHPCGVYARCSREQLGSYAYNVVIGEVALSGIVLEGETGYRAERATVRSLVLQYKLLDGVLSMSPLEIAAHLEARYAVEVELDGREAASMAQPRYVISSSAMTRIISSATPGKLYY